LDHLAVIAFITSAPLVTDSLFIQKKAKLYYPQVKLLYIQHHQQILEHLALHHKRVFFSVAPYRRDLSPIIEMFYGKQLEFWYCPHGNSDKTLEHYALQTHALIYGKQMEERLTEEGLLAKLKRVVSTGNVRQMFYRRFKSFYDEVAKKEVFSRFKKAQPTYLYAPTWEDFEASSSLFQCSLPLLEQLPPSLNLIVKLHPWLKEHQPSHVHALKAKYEHHPNIIILCDTPYVFPLLERVDVYIGDFSSIGYDFLTCDRPMFFFDPKKRVKKRKHHAALHKAGKVIPENALDDLFGFIKRHLAHDSLFSNVRKELDSYAFGDPIAFEEIKRAVEESAPVETVPNQK